MAVPRFSYFGIRISIVVQISSSLMHLLLNGIVSYRCFFGHVARNSRVTTHIAEDSYAIIPAEEKFSIFCSSFKNFWLSGITCICYKNWTHVPARMNTPNLGPIIEVTSQRSDIGDHNETRVSRETNPAIHPFGSALLRLELVLSLICVRRTRAAPPKQERGSGERVESRFQRRKQSAIVL
jgi:hypothetical protein